MSEEVVGCVRCHRKLTLGESIRRRMGRVCYGKVGAKLAAASAIGGNTAPPTDLPTLTAALLNITDCIMHASVHEHVSYILARAAERQYRLTVEGLYGLHAILYQQVEVPHVRDGQYERLDDAVYVHLGDAFAAVGLPEERDWLAEWRSKLTVRHIKRGVWLLGSTGGQRTYAGYIGAVLEMLRTDAYAVNKKLKDGYHTACAWKKLDVEVQLVAEAATAKGVLDAWNVAWGDVPTSEALREHPDMFKTMRVIALSI